MTQRSGGSAGPANFNLEAAIPAITEEQKAAARTALARVGGDWDQTDRDDVLAMLGVA